MTGPQIARASIVAAAAAALAATLACGSSSQTETVTGPSPTRCTVQVAPEPATFPPAGGAGAVRVTTNRECAWSARSDVPWLTVGATASGQGDGTFPFTVAANTDPAPRTTGLAINDQQAAIAQEGRPCELRLSSTREVLEAGGGERTIQVNASSAQCTWTAAANVPWITVAAGREGRGSGPVVFRVEAAAGARSGTLTIAGQTVQVEQGTGCSFSIGASDVVVDASGGLRDITVSAPAGCPWTAESHAAWIAIAGGSPGAGSGAVSIRVSATEGPARTGAVTVAGRLVTVTQSPGCLFAVEPRTFDVPNAGGPVSIRIDTAVGCEWTATTDAAWLPLPVAGGRGPARFDVSVPANPAPARTGAITIAGRTVTVSQAAGCTYAVQPGTLQVPAAGGPSSVRVDTAAGCEWTAAADAGWIALPATAGRGPANVDLTVSVNTGPARRASLAVAGRTVAVEQASGCTYSISPSGQEVGGAGGGGAVSIATGTGCPWTASTGADWISISTGAGTGPAQLQFTVPVNAAPARSGTITIAGRPFTVTQLSLCTYAFAPPSHAFGPDGGAGNVLVLVSGPCSWTATTTDPWITLTAGTSGNGNGLLQFVVPSNPGPARSGIVTIAGQSYAVTQAGR